MDDQGKAAFFIQTKKSDSEIVMENDEKCWFCPQVKEMDKMLDDHHPFTYNSIVKYVRNSGKKHYTPLISTDYKVMKPFERGVKDTSTIF